MESEHEAESEGARASAPGSGDDGLDLHLAWVNGPPAHRVGTAVSKPSERPIVETRPGVDALGSDRRQSERMRLVLALGQSEVELRGAIDAIDARAAGRQDDSMEEVREYLASAFDAVRELTGQLVTLTDRLELASGRPPSEQIVELAAPPPPAPVDSHAIDRLERSLIRIASGQEDILRELERLSDEVEAYRRRVQVHARPPVITDAQVEEIVARLGGQSKPARPMPPAGRAAGQPEPASVEEPALAEEPVVAAEPTLEPAGPERRTPRRTRRGAAAAVDVTPEPEPVAVEEPVEEPVVAGEPAWPEPGRSRRARRAGATAVEVAPEPEPVVAEEPQPPLAEEPVVEEAEPRTSRRARRAAATGVEAAPAREAVVDEEPEPIEEPVVAAAPAAAEPRPSRRARRAAGKAAEVAPEPEPAGEPEPEPVVPEDEPVEEPVVAAPPEPALPEKRLSRRARRAAAKAAEVAPAVVTAPEETDEHDGANDTAAPEVAWAAPDEVGDTELHGEEEADHLTPAEELAAALDALRPSFAAEARREQEVEDQQRKMGWRERRRLAQAEKAAGQAPSAGEAEDDEDRDGPSEGSTEGGA